MGRHVRITLSSSTAFVLWYRIHPGWGARREAPKDNPSILDDRISSFHYRTVDGTALRRWGDALENDPTDFEMYT